MKKLFILLFISFLSFIGISQKITEVTIRGEESYPNTNWDNVHGYFSSRNIDNDLAEKVNKKLKSGNYKVSYVKINSYLNDDKTKVITVGKVGLIPNQKNPHKSFMSRGSIGGSYVLRHDRQDVDIKKYIKSKFIGCSYDVFGPYKVTIYTPKGQISYKQSFYAVTKKNK
jgi:hypothetical protein